jgi:hypothetical protein
MANLGCGFFQSGNADLDADLSELESSENQKKQPQTQQFAEPVETAQPASVPQQGVLELKLTVNEPFPLQKTVEQRLTETDSVGKISVSKSRTDMMLSLNVDEIRADGRKVMTVQYHRVQYEEDIRGVQISYSSAQPPESIPRSCLLYAGLAKNYFSFIVGPNNKVLEIIDFKEFLQRCLSQVPSQDVAMVRQQLEATTRSEDGIATFIDDSIGLLPFSSDPTHPGVEVKEGSEWKFERYTENPIPIYVTTTCTLNELSRNSAEISLAGLISGPPKPIVRRGAGGEIKILVKGGYSTGSCRVDRKTGLPTQSLVHRYLEMAMDLPNGQKIDQSKETVSTITSFLVSPQQSSLPSERRVQQTGLQHATGAENHRQVQQAGGVFTR